MISVKPKFLVINIQYVNRLIENCWGDFVAHIWKPETIYADKLSCINIGFYYGRIIKQARNVY